MDDGNNDEGVTTERPLAFVDIDGVLADVRHRLHYIERRPRDWDAFFAAAVDDPAHPEGIALVETLRTDHEIVFLTGRPRRLAPDTEHWLREHGVGGHRLVMRAERDRRPAATVKLELLRQSAGTRPVAVVVDDDTDVIRTMRNAGYPTFHATWEPRGDAEHELHVAQEQLGRT
jgi:phosphoglycolate phosphatase-like HAD superfamily hydrolase